MGIQGKNKGKKQKNFRSMKWNIVLSIVPIILIVMSVIYFIVYQFSAQALIKAETEKMSMESRLGAVSLEKWVNEATSAINTIADTIQENRIGNRKNVLEYLQQRKDLIPYCDNGLYIIYKDGTEVDAQGKMEQEPSYLEEDWYQFCASHDTPAFDGCSYFEEDGKGEYSVTIGRAIKDANGELTGIIAVDAFLDEINQTIIESEKESKGKIILFDKRSQMIIGATEEDLIGKEITQSGKNILEMLADDLMNDSVKSTYVASGKKFYTMANCISGTDWVYLVYIDQAVALQDLMKVKTISILGVIVLIVLISGLSIVIIQNQTKEIKAMEQNIQEMAHGDFTMEVKVNEKKRQNEIGVMGINLKGFIQKMKSMIEVIVSTSKKLLHHANIFSKMAKDLSEDAKEEQKSLESLTTAIGGITSSIQTLAENASDLAGIVEETQVNTIDAQNKMQNVVEISSKSNQDIQTIDGEMKQVEKSMEELDSLVAEVSAAAEKITSIINVIKSIAEETNLLSLNASIEAARAGEQGRGFAVVADQIKNLANTSEENADAVERLIDGISDLIQRTSISTKQSVEGMRDSFAFLDTTTKSFQNIMDEIDNTKNQLNLVVGNVKKVERIATDIAAISEEQAASSEEILATAQSVNEKVTNTMEKSEKIRVGTEALSIAADDLQKEMQFFQI